MGKKTRNYLALDLGAESGRAIIGRFDGRKLTLEEVHRFGHTPFEYLGTRRWDTLMMAHQLKLGLAAAAERTHGDLASLAVDTWGVDYVLLDKNDDLLGYPFQYRDMRNFAAMDSALATLGADKLYKTTGTQFMQFNTLFQLHAEARSGSARLEAARSLMFTPDFLAYTLGGEKTCEYTIASTSQMLDAKKATWAKSLLKPLGIPDRILLPITHPGTARGRLHADVAAATGAPKTMKVIAVGGHDTASAVAAIPGRDAGWAYVSSGTWSLLGVEAAAPVLTAQSRELGFTNEGGLNHTIRLLTNIMGLWLVQELRRAWTDRQGNAPSYAELAAEAAKARPFGSLVNPSWTPVGLPDRMPEKFTAYCKATRQTPPATRGEFVRCALESLALAYRHAIAGLNALRPQEKIERLYIGGGGTQNELLNQMASSACGMGVLAGPVEVTAAGNVLGQMLADKTIKTLAEGREIIRASFELKRYNPKDNAAWNDAYGKYVGLLNRKVRNNI